ncbi:ATP-dependent DNA helicase MCM (intein-containing) [Natrialba magadii ATCC 43099]|uniref:DNA helicase n=1 Tax=Natrialba magadii (strain ATCC 43099 / DSM 3394 / CCM 3739 / CIP 104546 / IAM 13178 / JCM 8861 / NBRC 102185 / NCIMB 2190 / MS3) TaxID=547559 RepID=D3SWA2_NATMM|nr:LAGLIDADG family homing endonuclease [Natrialba magadii]ADD05763.1 ATP-dependent DNA helicase MCM (intein-containing) [Natrialba magadii ATCC 43099]ELY30162.1 XRE family transcriptional regulator [Natrialba magadii ATCC 43099]
MAQAGNSELVDAFEQFFRNYYDNEIKQLAQQYPNEQRSLHVDWQDLYRFDPDLADDVLAQPEQLQRYAEEALRLYDLPIDVSLGQAHVRIKNLPETETPEIREIRARDMNSLVEVHGIVRKATDVRPKIEEAAFECQLCGTLSRVPQSSGDFQEPHECQGCERQGPFKVNFDQSEFVDSQKLRIQESPEGLRGGETPQALDVHVEDDITGEVTPGDHVSATGVLRLEQQSNQGEKTPVFDFYMEGMSVDIDEEQFEDMDITDEDKKRIYEISNRDDVYEKMVGSIAPSIYGYDQEKLAMTLQLFSGVTKHLPDGSRIRGDLHMLLIGDPGTGKSQMIGYIQNIAPRSVYTSGKGSSSAGLTAAAVRDDFGDGQQWTLEAGALVLADQGIAAVDELDKMRCVTGDTLVHTGDGIKPIRELAHEAVPSGSIEELKNGRTIRDVDVDVLTMTEDGSIVKRDVSAIHEYDAPDELHEITLESGEQLTTTADHPFFVLNEGNREERQAQDLNENDWIFVPDTIPATVADGGVSVLPSADAETETNRLSPSHGAILGYIAGDGNIFYDRDEGCYGFRFTNNEEELLSDFEETCTNAFSTQAVRHPSEQRADGVETVRVHGKQYVDELLDSGANLENYDGKRLPEAVTSASRETKSAFIRALADSEGTVDKRAVKLFSSSYELLLGTKMLLLEFGISSQIQTRPRDGGRDLFILAITSRESLEAFKRSIGFTLKRKHRALERACERTTGDRTILDVLPECGELFEQARGALRLYQSECGLENDSTYCNFENGDANASLRLSRPILEAFEDRKLAAKEHYSELISEASWERLAELREQYHISQQELAAEMSISQQQLSAQWGGDFELQEQVRYRLRDLLETPASVDLDPLRGLIESDVKWRRVETIRRIDSREHTDARVRVLEQRLADEIGAETVDSVRESARSLIETENSAETWDELRIRLETYGISFQQVAAEMDVAGSTVSRWFSGTVDVDNFEAVRSVCEELLNAKRRRISELLQEIDRRDQPRVYDLTVEGTHNFVANGMVVHNSEDRSAMHEALEQQKISVSKAGINATLKSRCSLLGAANPKYGRFDQYEPISEQIDLEPALISRFDLIFTVTDTPDEEKDRNLAEHILTTNYAGELTTQREQMTNLDVSQEEIEEMTEQVDPEIDADLLRKYIAFSKQNCHPRMTEEARESIRDFYVNLRSKGTDEDAAVPVTARKLEALVRLSEASARVRLSDTVEQSDADRVIEIVRSCLQDVGVDPETGEFDADIVEAGTSKSQRDRIKNLKQLISDIEEEYDDGAPVDIVMDRAEEIGMDHSKAEHEIEKLKQKGEVYEPSTDNLRTT